MRPKRLQSVGDACDFVKSWVGTDRDVPWQGVLPDVDLPPPLVALCHRLGGIWQTDAHPFWTPERPPSRPRDLFHVQDGFMDPRDIAVDTDAPRMFLNENQGVWSFGYRPGDDRLYARGNFLVAGASGAWRVVDATRIEDALIAILLGNLFWLTFPGAGVTAAGRDPDLDILVWDHGPWSFDGFWTDAGMTRLHFSDLRLTIPRPAPPRDNAP